MTANQNPQYLVESKWLKENSHDPDLRIFDCTTYLTPDPETTYKIESGRDNYEGAHIPGSAFIDLQGELSDNNSNLRFTLPDKKNFEASAASLGISNHSHLILYSCTHPMWATRVWWIFRTYGHQNVSILNGGFSNWQAQGYEVSKETRTYPGASYTAVFNPELLADINQVKQSIASKDVCILNTLGRSQHRGEGPHYGRPGRIAGSEVLPALELIDADSGLFLDAAQLQKAVDTTSASSAGKIITYCGGGIAASATLFALSLLGREQDVALYDGSLSEWARDPEAEMQSG